MEEMTEDERGRAVVAAAESSGPASLDIINALLEGKNISVPNRGLAVWAAALTSTPTSLDIINALLKDKNISEADRGSAVQRLQEAAALQASISSTLSWMVRTFQKTTEARL